MSIRENFSNTISLSVANEYDKAALTKISTVLRQVYGIIVEASSETRIFRHLSDYVFGVRNFESIKSMRVLFLFKKFKI